MFYLSYLLLASLPLLSAPQQVPLGAGHSSPFTPSFEKFVAESLDKWHTPGLAVAVVDGEKTYSKGYGIAEFPDKPVTPSTLFYTGSTTKSFTAAAVSLLIDDAANSGESLSWQTPLAKLIREDFVLQDEYTMLHATMEDALSHRTGMPRHDFSWATANITVQDVVRKLRYLPLTAEIRTRWQYCNLMFIAIAHVIETWTGKWLGDFLRVRIYEPLNMTSTFFSLKDAQDSEALGGASLARGYHWDTITKKYIALPWLDSPQVSGAGGTISNVLDYSKWLRCHMTKSSPLSPSGHDALHSPRMISSPLANETTGFRGVDSYALGWDVSNYRGETMIWHSGGVPGFMTIMLYLPQLQWGLTAVMNGEDVNALMVLVFRLLDDMLEIPEENRFDWVEAQKLQYKLALEAWRNARDLLYPKAPKGKDTIPLSLPLESYTGLYTHPAYPSVTVTLNSSALSDPHPTLYCQPAHEQIFPISISLQHVSGEYFLAYAHVLSNETLKTPDDFNPTQDFAVKASFTINEEGQVDSFGIQLELEMGGEESWFKKSNTPPSTRCSGNAGSIHSSTSDYQNGAATGQTTHQAYRHAEDPEALFFALRRQKLAPLFAKHV